MAQHYFATFVVALISHFVFKRREPSPLVFLSAVGMGFLATFFAFTLTSGGGVLSSILSAGRLLIVYLISLSMSIIIYRVSWLHPLSAFPGPKGSIISKWWMIRQIVFKGGRHKILRELHEKHGPWVRIGPNELSISSAAAVRSIYKLDRAPFYNGTPAKAETLVTVIDRHRHLQRRQGWNDALSPDALYSYVHLAQNRVQQLCQYLAQESENGAVNFDKWVNLFFMDLMGDTGFSGGFETMAAGKDPEGWIELLHMGVAFASMMGSLPWLRTIIELLPQHGPIETFQKFTAEKVHEIRSKQEAGCIKNDILSFLLDNSTDESALNAEEAAADATLIVVAATDTSVQTTLALVRYLSTDEERHKKLQQEIDDMVDEAGLMALTDMRQISKLSYLDACFQESLRIMPPGPFGHPRTTGNQGATILGVDVPPNTTVHMPVFAMHRDRDNFGPLADEFIPERWLDTGEVDDDLIPCNKEAFIAFSAGYASCAGKSLAVQNIKILISHLLYMFEFLPAPTFDSTKYDGSFKEYGLWSHDPLYVTIKPRDRGLSM